MCMCANQLMCAHMYVHIYICICIFIYIGYMEDVAVVTYVLDENDLRVSLFS
jgi:hypothetical protein